MRALRTRARHPRGIALISTLLAVVLLMIILAVMVNICTTRLRRANEELHAVQALAAADSGAAWVRALLVKNAGSLTGMLADLAAANSSIHVTIDGSTNATVSVSIVQAAAGSATQYDHLDENVQENPQIDEQPAQIVATASVFAGGRQVATRTVTTLLRTFQHFQPYSEVVGVIDDAGPSSIDSPGDPAGQIGSAFATELLIHARKQTKNGTKPADQFQNDSWSDNNMGPTGFLP